MNYLSLIKYFWRLHEKHAFTATEIALYFYLLEVCNICRWDVVFRRNNAKVQADLGVSYNILRKSRMRLQECGLITFVTRNGDANTAYSLFNPDEVRGEVAAEVLAKVNNREAAYINKTETKIKNKTTVHPAGEVDERFIKFVNWMEQHAGRVALMPEPFTLNQFLVLRSKYDSDFIQQILLDMHNWQGLDKQINANRTFENFAKKRTNDTKY